MKNIKTTNETLCPQPLYMRATFELNNRGFSMQTSWNLVTSFVQEVESDLAAQEREFDENAGSEPYCNFGSKHAYAVSMCTPDQVMELWEMSSCEYVQGFNCENETAMRYAKYVGRALVRKMIQNYCKANKVLG